MKNWFYLSMAFALLPLSMMAQDDDMYFGSAKKQKSKNPEESVISTKSFAVCHCHNIGRRKCASFSHISYLLKIK